MRTKAFSTWSEFLHQAVLRPWQISWPAWMPRLAFSGDDHASAGDVLIVVFLRGAADALNILVPFGEEAYYQARPTLSIPPPDDLRSGGEQRTLPLDDFFGLHPSLQPLLPAWQAGHLAPVIAVGAPDESRSHFRAMDLMERGVEDESGPASGWIGRHLASLQGDNRSPLRAVGLGEKLPQSLRGPVPAAALRSIADFHLGGDLQVAAQMQAALANLYAADPDLGVIGRDTLEMLQTLERLHPRSYVPDNQANYPESEFGLGLQQIAMLIKAQVGLEVAAIDLGGWDTHFAQGGAQGLMAGLLADLGQGLAALHADLDQYAQRMTLVVMSEFGRRAYENASLGTDHGHGGMMLLLGGNVQGGRVHGSWPGLHPDQLFGPGDLAVTLDYRDVLGEVIARRLKNPALDAVFPDYRVHQPGFLKD